jgi:hypothetical protein
MDALAACDLVEATAEVEAAAGSRHLEVETAAASGGGVDAVSGGRGGNRVWRRRPRRQQGLEAEAEVSAGSGGGGGSGVSRWRPRHGGGGGGGVWRLCRCLDEIFFVFFNEQLR